MTLCKPSAAEREAQLMGYKVSEDILNNRLDNVPWDNMHRWTVQNDVLSAKEGPDVLVGGVSVMLVARMPAHMPLSNGSIYFQHQKYQQFVDRTTAGLKQAVALHPSYVPYATLYPEYTYSKLAYYNMRGGPQQILPRGLIDSDTLQLGPSSPPP